jgi:hypothetical protein
VPAQKLAHTSPDHGSPRKHPDLNAHSENEPPETRTQPHESALQHPRPHRSPTLAEWDGSGSCTSPPISPSSPAGNQKRALVSLLIEQPSGKEV